jgi:hypothetical protein
MSMGTAVSRAWIGYLRKIFLEVVRQLGIGVNSSIWAS